MRSYISQLRTSRSYFAWIAGILLSIALTLFIISHIHVRWSVFPFAYRNIGSVYSGLWYRHAVYSGRLVKFRITCANERLPCIKLILARSFIFGLTGFLFGLGWIIQFERDKLGSAAICALVGSFFSLVSGICAFFINSKESI
ncbi:unnamed protein product [Rotaria sp. Silwood2]|nr:unnamed protein product [Rotaria sp. Silwood2]